MAGAAESIDLGDITKMKVADLKKELKLRGIDTSGNKSQLVQRLQTAVGEIADTDSMLADTDEMLDEDEVLADETLDDEIDDIQEENVSPELPRSMKRKLSEKVPDAVAPMKKITLNRTAVVSSSENEVDESQSKEKAEENEGRKVIKFSEFSSQERLEKRAAKFGVPSEATPEARKQARAIRFGVATSTTSISNSSLPLEEEEKLKKRRERFGIVEPDNSSLKSKVTSSTTSSSTKVPITFSSSSSSADEEKKRLRAERFKIKT